MRTDLGRWIYVWGRGVLSVMIQTTHCTPTDAPGTLRGRSGIRRVLGSLGVFLGESNVLSWVHTAQLGPERVRPRAGGSESAAPLPYLLLTAHHTTRGAACVLCTSVPHRRTDAAILHPIASGWHQVLTHSLSLEALEPPLTGTEHSRPRSLHPQRWPPLNMDLDTTFQPHRCHLGQAVVTSACRVPKKGASWFRSHWK